MPRRVKLANRFRQALISHVEGLRAIAGRVRVDVLQDAFEVSLQKGEHANRLPPFEDAGEVALRRALLFQVDQELREVHLAAGHCESSINRLQHGLAVLRRLRSELGNDCVIDRLALLLGVAFVVGQRRVDIPLTTGHVEAVGAQPGRDTGTG